ncbi:Crp/Fnr family transcriptional regulator [uncultured Aquimarina sp.]|uniref:Crp/Fnr family transcriptional regulator n=1 Tax=uncultured Aquimarina sp. TaxID=575652 RepID=UPI00262C4AC8|nr:Crp/Fnr family transcriptional regulator [uncultured Aquimarina sp.]
MVKTLESIQNIYKLSDVAIESLKSEVKLKSLKKGSLLFSPQSRHLYISFIEKGLIRAYAFNEGKEITFWFGLEGDIVFPYRTYLKHEISYETAELLEDCILYQIPLLRFQELFLQNIEWATWGRKFAENQMVDLEQKFIAYQFKSASQRHEELLISKPELFNRIQLQYLASYLGMSQVSLSRIRAGIQ